RQRQAGRRALPVRAAAVAVPDGDRHAPLPAGGGGGTGLGVGRPVLPGPHGGLLLPAAMAGVSATTSGRAVGGGGESDDEEDAEGGSSDCSRDGGTGGGRADVKATASSIVIAGCYLGSAWAYLSAWGLYSPGFQSCLLRAGFAVGTQGPEKGGLGSEGGPGRRKGRSSSEGRGRGPAAVGGRRKGDDGSAPALPGRTAGRHGRGMNGLRKTARPDRIEDPLESTSGRAGRPSSSAGASLEVGWAPQTTGKLSPSSALQVASLKTGVFRPSAAKGRGTVRKKRRVNGSLGPQGRAPPLTRPAGGIDGLRERTIPRTPDLTSNSGGMAGERGRLERAPSPPSRRPGQVERG
ncbi:hypothetical protein THAOC_01759, partial [Thalassiosira oceanica]